MDGESYASQEMLATQITPRVTPPGAHKRPRNPPKQLQASLVSEKLLFVFTLVIFV